MRSRQFSAKEIINQSEKVRLKYMKILPFKTVFDSFNQGNDGEDNQQLL